MDYVKNLIELHILNQKIRSDQTKNSNMDETVKVTCLKCGNEITDDSNFCKSCGTKIQTKSEDKFCDSCGNKIFGDDPCANCTHPTNRSMKPKKKRSKKKKIGIAFGVIVLLFFGLIILSSGNNKSVDETLTDTNNDKTVDWEKTTAEIQQKILDKTDYDWQSLSYDELMRHNENYVGKIVNLRGQALQVQKVYDNQYMALVYSKCENFYGFSCNDDLVWINYSDVRMLDGDIISYWGDVKGLRNYQSILGAPTTVPEIDALAIAISVKKGDK